MTDLYDSEDAPPVFARGLPEQLPAGAPVDAQLARHEAIIHTHHEEIASLRVGRHRLGNAVSRVEGQLTGMRAEMRAEIEEVRAEVRGVRQEVAEIRPDVLRLRKLLAWGGGSGLVILAVLEVLGLLRG